MRISLKVLDMSQQLIWCYQVIRIEKKYVSPLRKSDAGILGLRGSSISLAHISHPRIFRDQFRRDLFRFIGRAVIDNDRLPVLIALLQQTIDCTPQEARIVVTRNNYRNFFLNRLT
ncbi:hypothetical protein D9M68_750960 [compost metagenome]